MENQNRISNQLIVFFTVIYLIFPTANSSSDAYGYASLQYNIGPHHLLYDFISLFISSLEIYKIINAIIAGLILFTAKKILVKTNNPNPIAWLLFIGSAYGFMRFATENETYIIPIYFSLLGTYFLLFSEYTRNYPRLIMAFAFLGIAILFHQIHLMWFIAASLALVQKKGFHIRIILIPITTLFLILGIYFFFAVLDHKSLIDFLKGDLGSETVQLMPGIDNFKFTGINFIRSFFQIHGNIALLWQHFFLVKLGIISAIILVGISAYYKLISLSKLEKIPNYKAFGFMRTTLIWAFILQLLFAWYSVGNAEFMVMLPLLLALIVASLWNINEKVIYFAATGMFIWNMTTAIIPANLLNFENLDAQMGIQEKYKGRYISHNKIYIQNYCQYKDVYTSLDSNKDDFGYTNDPFEKSPADIEEQNWSNLESKIDFWLENKYNVYTDCIDFPAPTSRKSILNGDKNRRFFSRYQYEPMDSFQCFYGKVIIYRIIRHR